MSSDQQIYFYSFPESLHIMMSIIVKQVDTNLFRATILETKPSGWTSRKDDPPHNWYYEVEIIKLMPIKHQLRTLKTANSNPNSIACDT
jgi:hypothetical protein